MAKDDKKGQQYYDQSKGGKDKDIHLNVIGVPPKNVNVNKTSTKQNSEEFQLYKINIDTKHKVQDRKHRIGSLEPVNNKNKKTKPNSTVGNLVSSSDSDSVLSRSSRSRAVGGPGRVRPPTSKPKKKGSVGDEICFTIPGEKGKAIRIVGSSTKPQDNLKPQEGTLRPPKERKSGHPRQVGFAKVDEVYGTTPEDSSLGSNEYLPYERTSPQVYKVENPTPDSPFDDLKGPVTTISSPKPKNNKELDGKSSQSPDTTQGAKAPKSGVHGTSSQMLENGRPSTSQGGSNYDSPTDKSVNDKGKYPFYPYDKQKSSRSPSSPEEPQSLNRQDDKSLRSEPLQNKKLPSIPEVRSITEYHPPQHPLEPQGVSLPVKQSSQPGRPPTRSNTIDEPKSSNAQKPGMLSSTIPKPENEPVLKNQLFNQSNTFESQNPPYQNLVSKSTSPIQLNVPGTSDANKRLYPTSPKTEKEFNSNDKSLSLEKPNPNQTEKPNKQNLIGKSKVQDKATSPAMKNDMQKPIFSTGSPDSNKDEKPKTPQGLLTGSQYRALSQKSSPFNKPNDRIVEEPLLSKVKSQNNKTPDMNKYKSSKEPTFNKTPSTSKYPQMTNKEAMTEKSNDPNKNVLPDQKSEVDKKSIPTNKQLDKDFSKEKTGVEKEPKQSKSKLSSFVSSIPKPSFRRNKSPPSLENKSTDKTLTPEKSTLVNSLGKRPATTNRKLNNENETKKPVTEAPMSKQEHAPVANAYPDWVFSSDQTIPANQKHLQPSKGGVSKFTTANYTAKEDPLPEQTSSQPKQFLPSGVHNSSSVEIANRNFDGFSLPEDASKTNGSPSLNNKSTQQSGTEISEKADQSVNISQKETPISHRGQSNKLKGEQSGATTPLATEENSKNQSNHDNKEHDGEIFPEYGYGKHKPMFDGFNVVAYPGKINEQTPFGYDNQYKDGPNEESEAMKSLENTYENQENPERGNIEPTQYMYFRDKMTSPGTSSSRNKENGYVTKSDRESSKYPIDSQLFPGVQSRKEDRYDTNKEKPKKDGMSGSENVPDKEKETNDRLRITSDGESRRRKSEDGKIFGKKPEEQLVYAVGNPDTTHEVFQSPDRQRDGRQKSKTPTTENLGPKGILIFVNKKNEAASPFQKNDKGRGKGTPVEKSKPNATKSKKPRGSKDKQNKENSSRSSKDTSTVTSLGSNSTYAGGDKNVRVEKSPSGTKVTQKYPCGCKKIISSGPEEQQKRIELISVNCNEGSECEVRQGYMLSQVGSNSRAGFAGSPGRLFPDIEVVADGVVSRKPIKPTTPAPTMNGANFTATLNIKSNKLNGVCNFYLDNKLKNYLRNNIDKLKLLLDDDNKR